MNIKYIDILIQGLINTNIRIDVKNNICITDKKAHIIRHDKIINLINIISTWSSDESRLNNILDSSEYYINIILDDDRNLTYHGINAYPYKYDEFLNIVGELNG